MYENNLIFGKDKHEKIVAVELIDNDIVCLTIDEEEIVFPCVRWILTSKPTKISKKLEGNQH